MLSFFSVAIYAGFAYALQTAAKKTNRPNDWYAWIPLFNFYFLIQIVERPLWWTVLLFIPFVNIVVLIFLLIDLFKILEDKKTVVHEVHEENPPMTHQEPPKNS